jgi:hypothetical protein
MKIKKRDLQEVSPEEVGEWTIWSDGDFMTIEVPCAVCEGTGECPECYDPSTPSEPYAPGNCEECDNSRACIHCGGEGVTLEFWQRVN